jgi:sulfur relay (sulfurtransferase) DsrF/TusC family protein
MTKEVTIILRSPPSTSSKVLETLRIAVAMVGMDMMPNILFCCEGVYCLLKGEKSAEYAEHLRSIADLAGIHVLSNSLEERRLTPSDLDKTLAPKIVSLEEASQLISKSSIVFAL